LQPAAKPGLSGWRIRTMRESPAAIASTRRTVSSREPLSTTRTLASSGCRSSERRLASMVEALS
jgi:hypothetical protein